MVFQTTIKHKASFSGVGLHSGVDTTVTLRPAEAGTGVVFHRIDLTPAVSIEAHADNVVSTRLSTTIGNGVTSVATIEHLVAALRGCGVDNVHVDINGPEVPIMDGSAADFVAGIKAAGRTRQTRPRRYLIVRKPVSVTDGDKQAVIVPAPQFRISFDIHFEHPAISDQSRTLTFTEEAFVADVCAARTFGFLSEVEMLKANGLARGGSLANAVVVSDNGIMNPEGLRYDDEFVRHKLLDSVGDLSLSGYHILGHVKASRSGHELNHRLVTTLLARTDCWKTAEFTSQETAAPLQLPLTDLAWCEA